MEKNEDMFENLNIILIVVDALRAENLSCYGYNKSTSPTIDSIARQGVLFENAFACIDHTDPSFTTILSGKYPLSHGIIHQGTVEEEVREFNLTKTKLLAQILKTKGYYTMAIDWLLRWHKRGYNFYGESMKGAKSGAPIINLLRERARELLKKPPLPIRERTRESLKKLPLPIELAARPILRSVGLSRRTAQHYTDLAIKLLRMQKGNFFMLIHYWDVHTPFVDIPKSYVQKFHDKKDCERVDEVLRNIRCLEWRQKAKKHYLKGIKYIDEIVAGYNGAINFVDSQIARMINFLKKQGIYEQTLLILTADHGDNLVRDGVFVSHYGLYDKVIHVPLIMAGGGLPQDRRIKSFVQHVDIVPTILDLLNVTSDSCDFDGKSVLPLIDGHKKHLHSSVYAMEATRRRFAIRSSLYKYIHSSHEEELFEERLKKKGILFQPCYRSLRELYNLENDPNETQNIIHGRPDIADEMENKLLEWIEKIQTKKQRNIIKNR